MVWLPSEAESSDTTSSSLRLVRLRAWNSSIHATAPINASAGSPPSWRTLSAVNSLSGKERYGLPPLCLCHSLVIAEKPTLVPLAVEVNALLHAISISSQKCQNERAGTAHSRRTAV